jgi:hypothetical protein
MKLTGAWRRPCAAGLASMLAPFAALGQTAPQPSPAGDCSRAAFEAVVAQAADKLRTLTQQHSPVFQGKLRALKDKRGWSHEQFMAEGARFVQDDKIADYEEKSSQLLDRINNASGGSGAAAADCQRLGDLRATMTSLVDIQTAKWTYMNATIDAELAK